MKLISCGRSLFTRFSSNHTTINSCSLCVAVKEVDVVALHCCLCLCSGLNRSGCSGLFRGSLEVCTTRTRFHEKPLWICEADAQVEAQVKGMRGKEEYEEDL